jgi:ABC-2 type transport system permease protein
VRFVVQARELDADRQGREGEAPLDEPVDMGVFAARPGNRGCTSRSVALCERYRVRSGQQTDTLIVNEAPVRVSVDLYNQRIDGNSDDDLTRVGGG